MSGHAEPVVRVSGARRSFGAVRALDGVDLEVEAGTWIALLGANGAGKTTLFRVLTGRLALDHGRVELLGERVDGRPSSSALRRLGCVGQEPALYAALTVRENLEVFATFHGVPRRQRGSRVAWALDWTGLADRARDRAGQLSGGMRRRLHIACAVLHRPALLLLDEPTVGVDLHSRGRILRMLDDLRRDGTALIHSSHELHEIERVADRVVLLRDGRVTASGPAAELIRREAATHRRVRLSLAAPVATLDGAADLEVDGREVRGRLVDPVRELPALLERVERAGGTVVDLHVDAPSLEDVFDRFRDGVEVGR